MDLVTARERALELMEMHGLIAKGWTFGFDRAKYRLGFCQSDRKLITMSKYFTGAANEDEFEQGMLHEIAHALLPAGIHHGVEWKKKAGEIGYRGGRLAYNPYAQQRRREAAAKRTVKAKRTVAHPKEASPVKMPVAGDILLLPNGRRIKVVKSDSQRTKAVAIDGDSDREWILSSPVAYNLIER